MKWESFRVPITCGCGCGTEIPVGAPVAVFRNGNKRSQSCAAGLSFHFDGDLFVSFDRLPQPSLVAPVRQQNVVTTGELDARRAKRATALERWKARRALRRQGVGGA